MTASIITSKATRRIITKFHEKRPGAKGTKICSDGPGHIINMTNMPIYV